MLHTLYKDGTALISASKKKKENKKQKSKTTTTTKTGKKNNQTKKKTAICSSKKAPDFRPQAPAIFRINPFRSPAFSLVSTDQEPDTG